MAFLDSAVIQAARVVVRQATETALTAVITSTTASLSADTATPTASSSPSSTSASASATDSSTLANGGATSGNNNNNNNNNNSNSGGNSSSLLFFVALGFGVVFTNLWIIVGVKYCFRYNARNRQLRNEDGEPINMENMPRPHRRRREKKLMPIDEVNEKFPMLKYKTWVASRAQEGLPTRGGVSAPPSRPNSIRDADGVSQELPSKERMSTDERPTTSVAAATATPTEPVSESAPGAVPRSADKPEIHSPQHAPKESTSSTLGAIPRESVDSNPDVGTAVAHKHMSQLSHDEDEEDEHIDAALPQECLGTTGDTCAICIDTLENDDDVRGLTCGHAFHAACIDPWLTTRRACCPLCKTDYYTPKPRPQPAEGGDGTTGVVQVTLPTTSRGNNRINLPGRPRPAFFGFGRTEPTSHNGRRRTRDNGGSTIPGRRGSSTRTSPSPTGETPSPGFLSGLRNALPGFRAPRSENTQAEPNTAVTPSQLEAGVRSPQS